MDSVMPMSPGGDSPTEDASAKRNVQQSRIHMIRRVGQGDLIVESAGRGHPVILIHGWGVDRRMWAHQVPALKRHFRTITYDRRGFGQSTCAAGLDQELEDLDAILDHFKLTQVALVGMSQGGRLALRYASTRPAQVSALVLQASPLDGLDPPAGDPTLIPTARLAELLRSGDRAGFLKLMSEHAIIDQGPQFANVRAEILAMLRDYRGEDLRLPPDASLTMADAHMLLSRITAPTLVITGSLETLWLRSVADHIARHIRGARRRVIRGGRHFVNMTHVAEYNRCLVDFIMRTTTPWSERALGIA